jgi:hypothetical protein
MALRLPNSIFIHMMKTGGSSIRDALRQMDVKLTEIGRAHDPACILRFPGGQRPFTFVFVRHPLNWYRSYWAYRMMNHRWGVHPRQPITGWQTFGSVLDHECRANNFVKWMHNVLAYMPEGFLSRIYRIYTEGVDFVGKVESLQEDFYHALQLAGEKIPVQSTQALPRNNGTLPKFLAAATFPRDLAEQVMAAESYVVNRWKYNSIPGSVLRPDNEAPRRQFFFFRWVS